LHDRHFLDVLGDIGLVATEYGRIIGPFAGGQGFAVGIVAAVGIAEVGTLDGSSEKVDLAKDIVPFKETADGSVYGACFR